jgi:hypothetical protein
VYCFCSFCFKSLYIVTLDNLNEDCHYQPHSSCTLLLAISLHLDLFFGIVLKKRNLIPPCDNHVSIKPFRFVLILLPIKASIPPLVISRRLLKTHPSGTKHPFL